MLTVGPQRASTAGRLGRGAESWLPDHQQIQCCSPSRGRDVVSGQLGAGEMGLGLCAGFLLKSKHTLYDKSLTGDYWLG